MSYAGVDYDDSYKLSQVRKKYGDLQEYVEILEERLRSIKEAADEMEPGWRRRIKILCGDK